jgi:photosystem II stability/assembly factor-like uncharacterized protein
MSVRGEPSPVTIVRAQTRGSGLVLGFATNGVAVAAVGGQGSDLFFWSDDGQTFTDGRSPGPGLRSAFLREDGLWVCGEYGYAALSRDHGVTWKKLETGTRGCLFGMSGDAAGNIWVAGDSGYLAIAPDGETLSRVTGIPESIARISPSPLGMLVPTDDPGYLYICRGITSDTFERTPVKAGDLMSATVTPNGTLLTVGKRGSIFRSTDSGKNFSKIESGVTGLLCMVDTFADGRVAVVGDGGAILLSEDDGASFRRIQQTATMDTIWCCRRHGNSMLMGGGMGIILSLP